MDIGFYGLRKFGRFIKRLFRWIPVLWKQEDWDYAYIYPLLEMKLQELRKCLREDNLHVNSDKYAMQISICLEYLNRYLHPDNYIEFPQEEVRWEMTKYGNILNSSKKLGRAATKSYYFEQENFRMFWKRFVQWHRDWWC